MKTTKAQKDVKRTLFFEHGNKWAEIEIEIKSGRFTASGNMGEVIDIETARQQALEYWKSFFDENDVEIWEMNKRCGTNFGPHDVEEAAQYVLDTDGEFHGLDVHLEQDNKVYTTSGGGQCLDSIQKDLPDFPNIDKIVELWEQWHLNDMHAGCEHQRKLGWEKDGYDKHPSEPCPNCGHKFGSSWEAVELPASVYEAVQSL